MSKEDLWTVIGRGKVDEDFAGHLLGNFERAVAECGYKLDESEIEAAKQAIQGMAETSSAGPPFPGPVDWQFQQEKMRERMSAQVARMNELGAYTVQILKNTLGNAALTYKNITWMNGVMFATGIGLFIFAAIYGAGAQQKVYSLVFGGLGAATFAAIFLVSPIEKTQVALSNLVQVEIAFMNYFEQITFWEAFALAPRGNSPAPDPANIERASIVLQERSQGAIDLLQTYIEQDSRNKTRRSKRGRKGEATESV